MLGNKESKTMTIQKSTVVRDAKNDIEETTIGTAPLLIFRTGSPPANCAAADSGTLLASSALPSDWLSNSSAGTKSKLGTWSGTSSAAGTVGHFRIKDSTGTTTHIQGTVFQAVPLTTSALTAANSNVLNFAATTGVMAGMLATGTRIPANATVLATTGTTVILSCATTAGVANATSVSFGGDMNIDNPVLAASQAYTVTAYSFTAAAA